MTATDRAGVGAPRPDASRMDRLSARGAGASRKTAGRWRMSSSDRGAEGDPSTLIRGGTTRDVLGVQRERPGLYFAAVDAVRHDTQRRIVYALAAQNGRVTYDDLADVTTTSDRTVRKHAGKLADNDLIQRTNANLVFFEFASPDAEILLREALARWYDLTDT